MNLFFNYPHGYFDDVWKTTTPPSNQEVYDAKLFLENYKNIAELGSYPAEEYAKDFLGRL